MRRGLTVTPNGARPAVEMGTVGRVGNFFGMLHARIAFAAGVMAAALLGGIALAGYTTGGFKAREQTDIIAQAASRVRSDGFQIEAAEPQAPMYHVCKGCDAKLYREDGWYSDEPVYDTDEEWAREERESRDVIRAALTQESHDREDRESVVTRDVPLVQDGASQTETAMARLDD